MLCWIAGVSLFDHCCNDTIWWQLWRKCGKGVFSVMRTSHERHKAPSTLWWMANTHADNRGKDDRKRSKRILWRSPNYTQAKSHTHTAENTLGWRRWLWFIQVNAKFVSIYGTLILYLKVLKNIKGKKIKKRKVADCIQTYSRFKHAEQINP